VKVLVVYDSAYGNTEKIAKAIGNAITGDVKVLRVGEVNLPEIKTINLLIIGSPTQGGGPTQAIKDFINKITESSLQDVGIAVFDTRMTMKFVGIFGYAAGRIANSLKGKGGNLIASPEGFFVKGSQGPLKEGELERAAAWAEGIVESKN